MLPQPLSTHPSFSLWRVPGSPAPPELSLKLLLLKSPRDWWPSNLPALQDAPTDFVASGMCLPDPSAAPPPPPPPQVSHQLLGSSMKSHFSLFSPDAVMRSHHFRSEVIYLARTLKVRRSSLSRVPILIICVLRNQ